MEKNWGKAWCQYYFTVITDQVIGDFANEKIGFRNDSNVPTQKRQAIEQYVVVLDVLPTATDFASLYKLGECSALWSELEEVVWRIIVQVFHSVELTRGMQCVVERA